MDYQQLLARRRSHPAWRLMLADHAPMIASFLHQGFVVTNARGLPREQLAMQLDDHLFRLHDAAGEMLFPKAATAYLDDWASDARGWLRKYYPAGVDEPHFDLTPAAEMALGWMGELDERPFIGTEARFLSVQRLLREAVDASELNPRARIAQLRARKADIDAEIARIEQGNLELMEPAQVRERVMLAADTAGELLSGFRAVEQGFRDAGRAFHERVTNDAGPAGHPPDPIAASDEGASFGALRKLLASPSAQSQLSSLVARVGALPAVRNTAASTMLQHLPSHLMQAVEATQDTAARVSRQLRRHLDERARIENRRITQLIRSIEKRAVAARDTVGDLAFIEIDDPAPTLALPMDRTLFSPPFKPRIRQRTVENAVDAPPDAASLFVQDHVDPLSLASNVRCALRARTQVSLAAVVQEHPIRHGLAELAAYLELAAHDLRCVIDEERSEIVRWSDGDGNTREVTMPLVIYSL